MVKSIVAKNCSELTLQRFIKCLMTADYDQLILKDNYIKPKKKDLILIWIEIYQEFTDLGASNEGNAYLSLVKQKTILNNKIYLINVCLESLKMRFNIDLVKVIKKLGIKGRFTKKSIEYDLPRAYIQLKSMIGRLKKIDNSLIPFTSGEEMTESDFQEILVILSKFQGYRLNAEEITVTEYVHILNSYKKWQTPKK